MLRKEGRERQGRRVTGRGLWVQPAPELKDTTVWVVFVYTAASVKDMRAQRSEDVTLLPQTPIRCRAGGAHVVLNVLSMSDSFQSIQT